MCFFFFFSKRYINVCLQVFSKPKWGKKVVSRDKIFVFVLSLLTIVFSKSIIGGFLLVFIFLWFMFMFMLFFSLLLFVFSFSFCLYLFSLLDYVSIPCFVFDIVLPRILWSNNTNLIYAYIYLQLEICRLLILWTCVYTCYWLVCRRSLEGEKRSTPVDVTMTLSSLSPSLSHYVVLYMIDGKLFCFHF